jgi:ATP-dependent DNA helicase RecQ
MLEFKEKYKATEYSLIKNYRSTSNIVTFNNELLSKIPNRLKHEILEPATIKVTTPIQLIRYHSSYLEKTLVDQVIEDNHIGTRAILVRTNKQALMLSTFLRNEGQKTRLITGLEGFRLADVMEIRTFTNKLKENKNDAGIIFNNFWEDAKIYFEKCHKNSNHYQACLEIILKFEVNYQKQKQLIDWYEYINEIKMEDAINADTNSIIIATIHKSKGKEFDHVYLLLENYQYADNESKRVLYVGCTRAKKSLQIHCNSNFFDDFKTDKLQRFAFKGRTTQPKYFEIILNHKEINLGSQKYGKAIYVINTLKTGDQLAKDTVAFSSNTALGLARPGVGNILLFSRTFLETTYATFLKDGYQLTHANVEYLLFWYDSNDDKEYKIVLPKLQFNKN